MKWIAGNHVRLLENGEAFFPRVFEVIRHARHEVMLETFILFEDKVGCALRDALVTAARAGARVSVLVDGYGSAGLSREFLASLTDSGVRLQVFDPRPKLLGMRTNVFRRMHRKLLVVDGESAFVGGINFSADHLADFGPTAKQDYAVEVRGPVVRQIREFMNHGLGQPGRSRRQGAMPQAPAHLPWPVGAARAQFVTRDNARHRTDIEQHYRVAIRAARRDLTIANAYFFPGLRLLRELRKAARRGVRVRLILQGEPDIAIVRMGARLLHEYLLGAGIEIYEYCRRPLHGKVAVMDDEWATVGSSNLDPLSLSLNLEANLILRDPDFNRVLRARLDDLVQHHCSRVTQVDSRRPRLWRALVTAAVFHVLRRFPAWAGWLPAHTPRTREVGGPPAAGADTHAHEAG